MPEPVLAVHDLRVELRSGDAIVEGLDLQLAPGEILGLVGESGSGKTTTALALLGYSAPGVKITGGSLTIAGKTMAMDESMRSARGSVISYVPQNPGRALNPSLRVIDALNDLLKTGNGPTPADGWERTLLDRVGLPGEPEFAKRFPHQLSGGQQQRVCIAAALCREPRMIVLDEPSTGLDVVTQAQILSELLRLRDEHQIGMIYVTHDLAVVAQIADSIAVMYAGRVVEQGSAGSILRRPRHPYTRGLLASLTDHVVPRILEPMPGISVGVGDRPAGCSFAPRCPQRTQDCTVRVPALSESETGHAVRCIHAEHTPAVTTVALGTTRRDSREGEVPVLEVLGLAAEHRSRHATVVAAEDVSFSVGRGECVALVGESGSGKTTIARTIAGLHPIARGEVKQDGVVLHGLARKRSVQQRRNVQLVFQNPAEALNPRHTAEESIARSARVLRGLDRSAARRAVDRLLEQVRLPSRLAGRYPGELSGGERQRVAIARALAAEPEIILCDEITSALDVSVQAAVLKLLQDLREELGLALLFITHDLGVVATIADRLLVLESGRVCESGDAATILRDPQAPYTQRLLLAAPSVATTIHEWAAYEEDRGEHTPAASSGVP